MGQTLTHGIYLPDEGERNCYAGLAANWAILDTSVGTIAEHTSALSGKAPLVHTHTKSDITDLFNSANTWSGYNTFTSYIASRESAAIPAGGYGKGVAFQDYQSNRLGYIQPHLTSNSEKRLLIGADSGDVAINSSLIPHVNNTYNLGSSSYQWNNLYAKNYYYNGTAFTDKFVTTDTAQTISVEKKFTVGFSLKNTAVTSHTTAPSSETNAHFLFLDGNDRYWGSYAFYWLTDGTTETRLQHTNYSTSGDQGWWQLAFGATKDFNNVYFKPLSNATINLGTSTNKWKSLNGINPGALSIFNPSATQDPIDVPNTWITDGSAWNTLNVSNMGDGWICLTYLACGTNDYILARFGGTNAGTYPSMIFPATRLADSGYFVYALMPAAKAMGNIYLEIKLDSNAVLIKHSFIPAYGTV